MPNPIKPKLSKAIFLNLIAERLMDDKTETPIFAKLSDQYWRGRGWHGPYKPRGTNDNFKRKKEPVETPEEDHKTKLMAVVNRRDEEKHERPQ